MPFASNNDFEVKLGTQDEVFFEYYAKNLTGARKKKMAYYVYIDTDKVKRLAVVVNAIDTKAKDPLNAKRLHVVTSNSPLDKLFTEPLDIFQTRFSKYDDTSTVKNSYDTNEEVKYENAKWKATKGGLDNPIFLVLDNGDDVKYNGQYGPYVAFFGYAELIDDGKLLKIANVSDSTVYYIPAWAPFRAYDYSTLDANSSENNQDNANLIEYIKESLDAYIYFNGSKFFKKADNGKIDTFTSDENKKLLNGEQTQEVVIDKPQDNPAVQPAPVVVPQETDDVVLNKILNSDDYNTAKALFDKHNWNGEVDNDIKKPPINAKTKAKRALDIANPNGPYAKSGITDELYESYALSYFDASGSTLVQNSELYQLMQKYNDVVGKAIEAMKTPFVKDDGALFLDDGTLDDGAYSYFAENSSVALYRKKMSARQAVLDIVNVFEEKNRLGDQWRNARNEIIRLFGNSDGFTTAEKKLNTDLSILPFKTNDLYDAAVEFHNQYASFWGEKFMYLFLGFNDKFLDDLEKAQNLDGDIFKLENGNDVQKFLFKIIRSILGAGTTFGNEYNKRKQVGEKKLLELNSSDLDEKTAQNTVTELQKIATTLIDEKKELEKQKTEAEETLKDLRVDNIAKNKEINDLKASILQKDIDLEEALKKVKSTTGTGPGTGPTTTTTPKVGETNDQKRSRLEKEKKKWTEQRDEAAADMIYYDNQKTMTTDPKKKDEYTMELKNSLKNWEKARTELNTVETKLKKLGTPKTTASSTKT